MVKGMAFIIGLLLVSFVHAGPPLRKIAFGSCNNQFHNQPLWKDMIHEAPDLFIWGGDNIYADTNDASEIKKGYTLQNAHPDYSFLKTITSVIGTWDDHDFAYDNATGYFPKKMMSQAHFLDFIEEPSDSPRRVREGIYTSYEYGEGEKKIKVILLDNRYFKDLEASAPLLGEGQWKWLDEELQTSTASLHFIMSGLSILSPSLIKSEEWADHSSELNRFLKLMKKYQPKGLVVLSGDKHFSSIFRRHGHLEFMSSGMTHTIPKGVRSYLSSKYPNTFFGLNYGLIDIAWEGNDPLISMAIRNRSGKDIHQKKYIWKDGTWEEL